jgi:signal transduction histidine kinase
MAASRKTNYFVFKHRLANGNIRDVEVYSTPILSENEKVLFSIIHDITEVMEYRTDLENKVASEIDKRRRHEQMMIQQSKQAAMGEMINAIAHQWRQPLNALGLLIQDLPDAMEYKELTPEYLKTMVGDALRQINFMSTTIDDFRDFFKPEKEKKHFDIETTIREVINIIAAQLRAHNITFSIHGESYTLFNHLNEFKQVLLNLLNNAKDAIIAQGKNGHIAITLDRNDEYEQVSISDTGGGIDDSIIARIFEPYFTTKDQGKGTGIGLYLVKTIVEEHMNGTISVHSDGTGATFVLRFHKSIAADHTLSL